MNNSLINIKNINAYNASDLPHDIEAEEILIGSLLSDNKAIENIENGLMDFHFSIPMLGRIYKAIFELVNKDQIANPLTLEHYFSDDEAFLECGGKEFLVKISEGNLGVSLVKNYVHESFFEKENIQVIYNEFTHPKYQQFNTKRFLPNLSIIDLLFNSKNPHKFFE